MSVDVETAVDALHEIDEAGFPHLGDADEPATGPEGVEQTWPDELRDDSEPAPFRIAVYTARELGTLTLPNPADPIVGPFIRKGMATLIGGLTGHGKTTAIAQMLNAAVAGSDFLGERGVGGARALVLDLEQHLASIQRVIREAGLDDTDLIDYAPIPEGLALDKRADQLQELERVLAAKPYDIVVLDPFYKLHEADSSDESQARLLVALLRRWIKEYEFALLTATHVRKLPAGRTAITIDDLFGSSLFTRDPELVLGIQRHRHLTKLHVFKSREPGLECGQVFELLFTRGSGFWLKPTKDLDEEEAELAEIRNAVLAYVQANPGSSTNAVKTGVRQPADPTKGWGLPKVKTALEAQVKSGLLPAPVKGSRDADLWYPLNQAETTSPGTLLDEVRENDSQARRETTSPDLLDPYVRERRQAGEVAEAELERLEALEAALLEGEPG